MMVIQQILVRLIKTPEGKLYPRKKRTPKGIRVQRTLEADNLCSNLRFATYFMYDLGQLNFLIITIKASFDQQ